MFTDNHLDTYPQSFEITEVADVSTAAEKYSDSFQGCAVAN